MLSATVSSWAQVCVIIAIGCCVVVSSWNEKDSIQNWVEFESATHTAALLALLYILIIYTFQVIVFEATLLDWKHQCALFVATILVQRTSSRGDSGFAQWILGLLAGAHIMAVQHFIVQGGVGFDRSVDMRNKVCIITGANTGIGATTAMTLAGMGAELVLGCRSEPKAKLIMTQIYAKHPDAKLHFIPLDLCSCTSVRQFVRRLKDKTLIPNVLINNAGVLMANKHVNDDGIEMSIATNHLGPFLLTNLLLPQLLATNNPRVINVGSALHHKPSMLHLSDLAERRQGFDMFRVYADSKLCNMLFTRELHRRFGARAGLVALCVHPGSVVTDVHRDMHPLVTWIFAILGPLRLIAMKSPMAGCGSSVHAATSPFWGKKATAGTTGGQYIANSTVTQFNPIADDEKLAEKLWEWSVHMTNFTADNEELGSSLLRQ
eukprot:m.128183 g.128183  ORF g.128183 m.128183 type:complete len:434 (+) comp17422_c0_seq4:213-1514(+)